MCQWFLFNRIAVDLSFSFLLVFSFVFFISFFFFLIFHSSARMHSKHINTRKQKREFTVVIVIIVIVVAGGRSNGSERNLCACVLFFFRFGSVCSVAVCCCGVNAWQLFALPQFLLVIPIAWMCYFAYCFSYLSQTYRSFSVARYWVWNKRRVIQRVRKRDRDREGNRVRERERRKEGKREGEKERESEWGREWNKHQLPDNYSSTIL